jgi:hypothetical protein
MLCSRLTSADNYAAQYIKSRPLAQSPAEPAHLRRCLKRYKRCLNHKRCKIALERNRNDTLPTRLLDVRSNSHLRLRTVPRGKYPLYAALSYCWGKSKQQEEASTRKENVDDRHRGIEISQLPNSIRDAVEVTRLLKIHYLWVDALCIVQDDDVDRGSEISKMGSIYRGSTLTIAAASAKESTESFLANRDLEKAYGNVFQLPYCNRRAGDVAKGVVLLSEQPVADTYQENIDERAWTMQEDILSPRLIRFGSKQTTWRCPTYHTAIKIDGGGHPMLENVDFAFSVNDPYRVIEVQSNISAHGPLGIPILKASWLHTVSRYTQRTLTHKSDKLPACAALAEIFADILSLEPSHYLAGLWQNDIYAQLLWYRPEVITSGRSSGPSWSWVSIDGPVEFFQRELLECDFVVKAEAKYVTSSMDYEFDSYWYSKVRSGRLELNGRLQQAHWDSVSLRRSINDFDVLPLKIYWDVSESIYPQTLWCFEIIGSHFSLGLVLLAKDQLCFERVGLFECTKKERVLLLKSYFSEVEPQTIAIY